MTVKTEGQHREEFLLRDYQDISRETALLTNGQNVVDGQAMKFVGGKLVAATGSYNSEGSDEDIAGLIIGNHNVSAHTSVVYVARLAAAKAANVVLHTGGADSGKDAAVKAALASNFIFLR